MSELKRLNAQEAAAFLSRYVGARIAPRTVLEWAARSKLPHYRVVGRIFFDLRELEAWLQAAHVGGAAAASELRQI